MNTSPTHPPVTPTLERELARTGQASYDTGGYRATVASHGTLYYEAWTDSLPFVYGKPATSIEGALANLEAAVAAAERATRPASDSIAPPP